MGKRIYAELIRPRNKHGFCIMEGLGWLVVAAGFSVLLITAPIG